ncbi:MAG TPA: alpha-L-fucosidase [Flavisolibacter sp.]|nr:alpha-L-fucosidase [Flavisolibacter sp.]
MKRFSLLKQLLLYIALVASGALFSQTYQPTWESLDTRPVPQWFKDAKFGIFIHWGVYSVPGFSSKGNYSEWYQNGLMNGDSARIRYHKAKFGNRTYYDLANDFKAELFQPDEWAKLFEQSGAKYIVLTSKHHDGYTLWPNKEADKAWGFPWNAVAVGPKRDLLGDLFKAVRKTSVRAGMYYSLYEWFNPLWKADHKKYAEQHAWPQMKELINNYQPDVFWTDGGWDAPAETWKSQEFLAWLYNESPVKDKIVTYDRWGSGIRFKHGLVFTPEYQPELSFDDHYWEESRGMGFSYGYNRAEDAWDYNSTQSLVLQLVDKVSRGGNFLLDIGPDEHGKIPPIMQERLLQIGDWLKINGEAIYNTVQWKTSSQWSEGRKDYKEKSGDMLLKITIDPEPGYAVKEVFYTYNPTANALYAILPKYPDNRKMVLKDMNLPDGTILSFLSTRRSLSWKQEGDNVVVELPEYNPNQVKAPYAFVIKIANYGKFATKPKMSVSYPKGSLQPLVSFAANENDEIRYTLDGSEPTGTSALYTKPFVLGKTATINAKAFGKNKLPSNTVNNKVRRYEWMKPVKPANVQPGIAYRYFEPAGKMNLEVINASPVVKEGVATEISESVKQRKEKYALSFEGYIKIEKDGAYIFSTRSDDGSRLFIDDEEVVNNDGDHGSVEQTGKAALKKGFHKIKVTYYDGGGGNELNVFWQREGGKKEILPARVLFH